MYLPSVQQFNFPNYAAGVFVRARKRSFHAVSLALVLLSLAFSGASASAQSSTLSFTPLDFGTLPLGTLATLPEALTNNGASSVTIFWAHTTNPAFTFSGLSFPFDLDPGASVTFQVSFDPTIAGEISGRLRVFSNGGFGPVSIPLSGAGQSGTPTGSLTIAPATADLGSVPVGTSKSLAASITAVGSPVVVSAATSSSPAFAVSGLTLPLTLAVGQSAPLSVTFTPQATGAASAQISFATDSGAPAIESLTGTGTAHSVDLAWVPSTSTVSGYNVYRSGQTGGPYTKVNTSLESTTTFADDNVQAGSTYFYVVTAVDSSGDESQNSNEAQVAVPSP